MKKCRYCKSDIDEKAKICPVCKNKQGSSIVSSILGLLTGVGLLAIGIFAIYMFIPELFQKDPNANRIYKIGEKMEFHDYDVTVLDYKTRERESSIWSAGNGNVFYIITIKFENRLAKEKTFFALDFSLIDENGVTYDSEDLIKSGELGSLALQKGGSATKDIRFAIPKETKSVTLKYSSLSKVKIK